MSRVAMKVLGLAIVLPLALSVVLSGCVAPQDRRPAKPQAVNLDAVLPPESLLRDDTLTALSHDRNESRLAYVGVWATDGDKCAMMDQTAFEGFAVITPGSIRRAAETCTFDPGEPGAAVQSFNATCKARGKKSRKLSISLQMLSEKTLHLVSNPDQPGVTMVRCRLLK